MTRVVQVPIKHLGSYVQKLGPRGMTAIKRGLRSGALHAIPILQRAQDDFEANNTGLMRRSWKTQVIGDKVRLFNYQPYSPVVVGGRRAGSRFPPTEVIARWAQRRLGLSRKEALAAAFPIARAIARRGIKARDIVGVSIHEIIKQAVTDVEMELLAELAK